MKRLICLISLMILLTGCNSENNKNDVENKQEELVQEKLVQEELVQEELAQEDANYVKPTSTQNPQIEVVQEPCPIEITSVYDEPDSIGDDTLNIVVKNNGTEAVKYFEAYAVFWDNNGYPLKANFGYDEVVTIYTENPNLTVGDSATWTWQPYVSGDDFGKAEIFVSKVELYDGTIWKDSGASSKAVKRFSELNK